MTYAELGNARYENCPFYTPFYDTFRWWRDEDGRVKLGWLVEIYTFK